MYPLQNELRVNIGQNQMATFKKSILLKLFQFEGLGK